LLCTPADPQAIPLFRRSPTTGQYELDPDALQRADKKGVGYKNARGDRPTICVTPPNGRYAEQALGMTRSLGDFYLHACGVTWVPEVSIVDLAQVADSLRAPVLFLASDGFWDLWSYSEVRARFRIGRSQPRTARATACGHQSRTECRTLPIGQSTRSTLQRRERSQDRGRQQRMPSMSTTVTPRVPSHGPLLPLCPARFPRGEQVFEQIVCEGSDEVRHAKAMKYMQLNQKKGEDEFGDTADNMTGILVYFDKQNGGQAAPSTAAAADDDDDDDQWI
jgi:hypothetical protein